MKIERGIPVAKAYGSRSIYRKTAEQMQEGDSVLCDSESGAGGLRAYLLRMGFKAATRKVEGGWRVWKLEEKKPSFGLRAVG